MKYWLLKSEPTCFSIDDLANAAGKTTPWDGVRNYQARNFMRDDMQIGDQAFFYHSNCKIPGIVGTVNISKASYPDFTAQDPNSDHYDPKSSPDKPIWYMVEVKFNKKFNSVISLKELKSNPQLSELPLVRKGNRLSVLPVTTQQWQTIIKMHP